MEEGVDQSFVDVPGMLPMSHTVKVSSNCIWAVISGAKANDMYGDSVGDCSYWVCIFYGEGIK